MTPEEAKSLQVKLATYRRLNERCEEIRKILDQITTNRPDDPNQTGPFTSNTRETRRITRLQIDFSKTLGGSPEVAMTLENLNMPARDVQQLLISLLSTEQGVLRSEMERL